MTVKELKRYFVVRRSKVWVVRWEKLADVMFFLLDLCFCDSFDDTPDCLLMFLNTVAQDLVHTCSSWKQ